jgi:hypothetical protein
LRQYVRRDCERGGFRRLVARLRPRRLHISLRAKPTLAVADSTDPSIILFCPSEPRNDRDTFLSLRSIPPLLLASLLPDSCEHILPGLTNCTLKRDRLHQSSARHLSRRIHDTQQPLRGPAALHRLNHLLRDTKGRQFTQHVTQLLTHLPIYHNIYANTNLQSGSETASTNLMWARMDN